MYVVKEKELQLKAIGGKHQLGPYVKIIYGIAPNNIHDIAAEVELVVGQLTFLESIECPETIGESFAYFEVVQALLRYPLKMLRNITGELCESFPQDKFLQRLSRRYNAR